MISCTEFIPAYSEGFKFLEAHGGRKELEKYWDVISSSKVMFTLGKLVEKEGLEGCYNYWTGTLNEEAADFTMILDEIKGEFIIDMHKCPSKGMLNELTYLDPHPAYCEHCMALYKPVVEYFGYTYDEDSSRWDKAACTIRIALKERILNRQ